MAGGKYYSRSKSDRKPSALKIAKKALKLATVVAQHETVTEIVSDTMTGALTPEVVYLTPTELTNNVDDIKSLSIEYNIRVRQTGVTEGNVRVDFVLDRQPNGATLSIADCYGDATPSMENMGDPGKRERYKIVKSFQKSLITAVSPVMWVKGKFKTGQIITSENQDGDFSVTNISKNSYYLVYWTDTITANFPTIEATTFHNVQY